MGKCSILDVSSVQLLNRVWFFVTQRTAALQAALSITNSQSSLKLMSIESVMSSNHLIYCRSLLLPPSILPRIKVFSNESLLTSGGQSIVVSASASDLPMNIQDRSPLGLTAFISLLSKTLSSLLQHHSSKASILQHSAFFIVPLSHPYMITGKIIALTRWTFVGKVITLLWIYCLSSVQFSHSVVSDSLRPHESQHTRPPCPSPTPRVYSNSCPSSRWCHPAISPSVVPFSSCP